jgi:hypothetical protein
MERLAMSHGPVRLDRPVRTGGWAAYVAAVLAGLFAAVSFYWALGGTVGIATLGGQIEALAKSASPAASLLAWGAAIAKLVGVAFALALVRPWGRRLPRRLPLVLGWLGTALLVLYGAVNTGAEALVQIGVITVPPNSGMDWYAFHWHLFLWDPYFLVWGIALGLALRDYARATRPS